MATSFSVSSGLQNTNSWEDKVKAEEATIEVRRVEEIKVLCEHTSAKKCQLATSSSVLSGLQQIYMRVGWVNSKLKKQ